MIGLRGKVLLTTDENKCCYIIAAVEDGIVRILTEKEKEVNRVLTLDECVKLIRKKYWRENLKEDKLPPNESVCHFNTRFLELYDQLDFDDKSFISVIDYEKALRPRGRIYERVAMVDIDNLEDACNEMRGSYTTNIRNNYNSVIKTMRNFRNSSINIVTQRIQNNNLNKYTKLRQNTHNYYRFGKRSFRKLCLFQGARAYLELAAKDTSPK
ncbi:hypothetical protein U3516DRAFT_737617 [Neocallimastix sp. 'constans']